MAAAARNVVLGGVYTARRLEKLQPGGAPIAAHGMEIVTGARVTGVSSQGVSPGDGRFVPSPSSRDGRDVAAPAHRGGCACTTNHGRIVVTGTMAVSGVPGVWPLGDCAVIPDRRSGKPFPPTAQHAIREAATLADNIVASLEEKPVRAFEFQTLGQLAAIGRRAGVARIFGVNFSGFVAWWLWRTIYLAKLPRFEKKVRVALDWTLDLLFPKDFAQFLTVRGAVMPDLPPDRARSRRDLR